MTSFNIKPDKTEKNSGELNPKSLKILEKYDKKCKVTDKCRECTYEELKTIPECQLTGYKKIQNCIFSDGKKDIGDEFITESCSENIKMNKFLKYFLIFFLIGLVSFNVRRKHKNFMIKSMLEKLSILKDK